MKNMEVDAFGEIASSMDSMEKERKVDLSILQKIDSLAESLSVSEHYWLRNEEANRVDAFILYHAFRNMHSIVRSMRHRFETAADNRDNPKVVDDARIVLPSLFTVFAAVKPLETQALSPGLRSLVLKKVRDMRNAAAHARMLPSNGEGLAVDESQINEQTKKLAETLAELIV